MEDLLRVEGGPYEHSGMHVGETLCARFLRPAVEVGRRQVTRDGRVIPGGTQVLTEGEDVDTRAAQVGQHLPDFRVRLAQTQHEAALGHLPRPQPPRAPQHGQAPGIVALRAQPWEQAGRHLDVVIEHVGPGEEHGLQRPEIALEIGSEHLHLGPGQARAYGVNGGRELGGPAVGKVVTGHGGQDDVAQAEARGRVRDACRLARIGGARAAGGDRAVSATARASIAQQHEGRGAAGEAFREVGATSLLADRHQPLFAEKDTEGPRRRRERAALARPLGQAQEGRRSDDAHGFTINGLYFSSSRSLPWTRSASARVAKLPTRTLKRPPPSGETT